MSETEAPEFEELFKEFRRAWTSSRNEDIADTTETLRKQALSRYWEWFEAHDTDTDEITAPTADDMERYFDYLLHERNYAPATMKNHRDAIRLFLKLVGDEGSDRREEIVSSNGSATTMKERHVDSDEGVIWISAAEKEELIEHLSPPKIRNELIVRVLWQTAARVHELVNIRTDSNHLDRESQELTLQSSKTSDTRTAAYHSQVEELLTIYLDSGYRDRFPDSPYLFASRENGQISTRSVQRIVSEAAEEAGIQGSLGTDAAGAERATVTPHALRHGAGVQAVRNGLNVRYIQEMMGHEELSTTEIYLKIAERDAVNAYHQRGPGTESVE